MLPGPPQTIKSSAVPIYIDFATAKCKIVNICYHFCLLMILTSTFGNEKIQMIWSFVGTTLCLEWKIHQNIGDTFSLIASEGISLLVCLFMSLLRGTVDWFRRMRRKQTQNVLCPALPLSVLQYLSISEQDVNLCLFCIGSRAILCNILQSSW